MKLIVGLGNPGNEFDGTRHNAGFLIVDSFLSNLGLECNKSKFDGQYCELNQENGKTIFLKPQKYINLSGEVIKKYVDYFKIPIEDILIIHDDLDIPLGKYKLRASGSSAGHNGLKNIELNLGTKDYKRLKIGISNNKNIDTKDYVLGRFNEEEKEEMGQIIETSKKIIVDYQNMTFVDLMSRYNKK